MVRSTVLLATSTALSTRSVTARTSTIKSKRFQQAYDTLATDTTRTPKEAKQILDILQKEVDAVNTALSKAEDPSKAYANLPDQTKALHKITESRPSNVPTYLGLANINWDHFSDDARTAYNAGHYAALLVAAGGSKQNLLSAYSMNAFADHFLEDSFAAGHARTPQRVLHHPVIPDADICAKVIFS